MLSELEARRGPSRQEIALPFMRMTIVVLLMGVFALAFAGLTRQSDALSARPQSTASNCGEAAQAPCPTRRAM